jgi:hypothetical protein
MHRSISWIKPRLLNTRNLFVNQDCDFPEETTVPELRPHADVDVMNFLGLKRAKGINTGKDTADENHEESKP